MVHQESLYYTHPDQNYDHSEDLSINHVSMSVNQQYYKLLMILNMGNGFILMKRS